LEECVEKLALDDADVMEKKKVVKPRRPRKDVVFENERAIHNIFYQMELSQLSVSKATQALSQMGITPTHASEKAMRKIEAGCLTYTQFLKSLSIEDTPLYASPPPQNVKKNFGGESPLGTMLDPPATSFVGGLRRSPRSNDSHDCITWSTESEEEKHSGKRRMNESTTPQHLKSESPIATYTPPPSQFSPGKSPVSDPASPADTPTEQLSDSPQSLSINLLVREFVAGSLNGTEFRDHLQNTFQIEVSPKLDRIIRNQESGGNVSFNDFAKEITIIKKQQGNEISFDKVKPIVRNPNEQHVNVLDWDEKASPEKPVGRLAPHSLETTSRRDFITWADGDDEEKDENGNVKRSAVRKEGRRLGYVGSSTDIVQWGLEEEDDENAARKKKVLPHSQSRDITGWSSPAGADELPKFGKKRVPVVDRSVYDDGAAATFPWGTDLDDEHDINPHKPHLSKRTR